MKKILVIAALALVSFANAQKGTYLVAGNLDFNSTKTDDFKTNNFEFAPKVGYQFSDNMTVGIESVIGSQKDGDDKSNNLKVGGFLRYAKSLNSPFAIYADLSAGYQSKKDKTDLKSKGFYVGIVPAVAIDLKKSFALNFSIGGLGYDSMKPDGGKATNTFDFNFGRSFSIGVSKNF